MADITMPRLSDTMEEGKILKWRKQVGDRVAIGEIIAEVETDKADMELEAFDEGVLTEVRTAEGETAPVGAVIAVLGEAGAKAASKPAAESTKSPAPAPKAAAAAPSAPAEARRPALVRKPPAPDRTGTAERPASERAAAERAAPERPAAREPGVAPADRDRPRASPLARRVADEHGVDLHAVSGTGPGGRIVEQDVRAAIGSGGEAAATPAPKAAPRPAQAAPATSARVDLSRIRRTTAKRMGEAKREVPHFYASADIGADDLVRAKDQLAALGGEWEGVTYTHLLLKAVGLALRRVPELNASYDGDALVLHPRVNVGLATAVDDGLVVPVVHDCDTAPLAAIVRQTRELVARARSGKFASDDLSGATFTVSNLGMFPVSEFAAIINPPQAAILAVGAIRDVPVAREGRVVPGRMMTVTLSCDHRVIDGVLAGRFLRELKTLLEGPFALLV